MTLEEQMLAIFFSVLDKLCGLEGSVACIYFDDWLWKCKFHSLSVWTVLPLGATSEN